MCFARAYLYFVAVMGLVFGVWYLVAPAGMTDPTGFGPLAPNALTDVRATYERHVNPTFTMLLGMLGYGRIWTRAEATHYAEVECIGAVRHVALQGP